MRPHFPSAEPRTASETGRWFLCCPLWWQWQSPDLLLLFFLSLCNATLGWAGSDTLPYHGRQRRNNLTSLQHREYCKWFMSNDSPDLSRVWS